MKIAFVEFSFNWQITDTNLHYQLYYKYFCYLQLTQLLAKLLLLMAKVAVH